jgi:nitrogen fixation/metabolism regulation signal transduction histidine kinase
MEKSLGSALRTAGVVSLTTASVLAGLRALVARELGPEPTSLEARDLAAELESRVLLAGGIALCLAVAITLLREWLREGMEERNIPLNRGGEARQAASPNDQPPGASTPHDAVVAELDAARQRLARTERIAARREVARQVAHEIKNPLAPIQASIETLRRLRDRGSPEFDGYFDEATRTVLAEVRRIATIVREFSEYARLAEPRFAPVDLEAALRSVASLHDATHVTGGHRVTVDAAPCEPIIADADQLTQVFTNLVKNGLEAASTGLPRVDLELRPLGLREVRVVVRDNGRGVEPSIRDRLFEPSLTTKRDGAGIGLTIVQTIVHEHGGEVRLLPDDGRGAAFEVVLPREGPPVLTRAPAVTNDPHAR